MAAPGGPSAPDRAAYGALLFTGTVKLPVTLYLPVRRARARLGKAPTLTSGTKGDNLHDTGFCARERDETPRPTQPEKRSVSVRGTVTNGGKPLPLHTDTLKKGNTPVSGASWMHARGGLKPETGVWGQSATPPEAYTLVNGEKARYVTPRYGPIRGEVYRESIAHERPYSRIPLHCYSKKG